MFLSKRKYSLHIRAKNFELSEVIAVTESGRCCFVLRKWRSDYDAHFD